ncbi:hypothetical protein [Pedobacter frigoris]|uniref:hypothetical protein n=1 Tax=Pedobacter frigoris TaxID=2571272 RepID=UPI00292F7225|nr:hypothetical protein [Pedobacter frigoris]
MKSLVQFLLETEQENLQQFLVCRNQELAGIKESTYFNRYSIQLIVTGDPEMLMEHQMYRKFAKTNNLYTVHPEDKNVPVKRHYHIVDKHKREIYAINTDGTAHHRSSSGVTIPKKEAEELEKLGVVIPENRLIESQDQKINECIEHSWSIILIIYGE